MQPIHIGRLYVCIYSATGKIEHRVIFLSGAYLVWFQIDSV